MRLTRHTLYTRIFSALSLPLSGDILGISGLKYWRGSPHYQPPQKILADTARITEADYPNVTMLELPYADNSFDYVICDQVLEHIEGDPQQAIDEAHRVLRPGGTLIAATVFIHPKHYGPKDMWRFSPDALRYLCRNFSEVIQCEGWGNRWIHILFFLYDRARDWEVPKRRLSLAHYLSQKNDTAYPLATWIVVKK